MGASGARAARRQLSFLLPPKAPPGGGGAPHAASSFQQQQGPASSMRSSKSGPRQHSSVVSWPDAAGDGDGAFPPRQSGGLAGVSPSPLGSLGSLVGARKATGSAAWAPALPALPPLEPRTSAGRSSLGRGGGASGTEGDSAAAAADEESAGVHAAAHSVSGRHVQFAQGRRSGGSVAVSSGGGSSLTADGASSVAADRSSGGGPSSGAYAAAGSGARRGHGSIGKLHAALSASRGAAEAPPLPQSHHQPARRATDRPFATGRDPQSQQQQQQAVADAGGFRRLTDPDAAEPLPALPPWRQASDASESIREDGLSAQASLDGGAGPARLHHLRAVPHAVGAAAAGGSSRVNDVSDTSDGGTASHRTAHWASSESPRRGANTNTPGRESSGPLRGVVPPQWEAFGSPLGRDARMEGSGDAAAAAGAHGRTGCRPVAPAASTGGGFRPSLAGGESWQDLPANSAHPHHGFIIALASTGKKSVQRGSLSTLAPVPPQVGEPASWRLRGGGSTRAAALAKLSSQPVVTDALPKAAKTAPRQLAPLPGAGAAAALGGGVFSTDPTANPQRGPKSGPQLSAGPVHGHAAHYASILAAAHVATKAAAPQQPGIAAAPAGAGLAEGPSFRVSHAHQAADAGIAAHPLGALAAATASREQAAAREHAAREHAAAAREEAAVFELAAAVYSVIDDGGGLLSSHPISRSAAARAAVAVGVSADDGPVLSTYPLPASKHKLKASLIGRVGSAWRSLGERRGR